jgi:hypothetical protein
MSAQIFKASVTLVAVVTLAVSLFVIGWIGLALLGIRPASGLWAGTFCGFSWLLDRPGVRRGAGERPKVPHETFLPTSEAVMPGPRNRQETNIRYPETVI